MPREVTPDDVTRYLRGLTTEKLDKLLTWLQVNQPDNYSKVVSYLKNNKGYLIEMKGYEHWLQTLGAQTFTRPFAPIHKKFWEWNWRVLMKARDGHALDQKELVAFLPWSREMGKCVSAGTEILKEDGTRVPIETIQNGDRLLGIDQTTGRCVSDIVKHKWASGKKHCLRIETRSGKFLTLTPEHRLWTIDGWKEAGQLTVGERIASPRKTRPRSSATKLDAEVKLTAYMIAEGCTVASVCKWTVKGEVRRAKSISCQATFTNTDSIIVEDFRQSAKLLGFGVKKQPRGRTYGLSGAQQWLRDTGLSGKGAHEKRLPQWVFQLSERQRWLFLAALIDTDGYVTRSDGVAICLANKELINDIAYLLTSVGVPSKIYYKPNAYRGAWVLQASKGATGLCAEKLPLILKGDKVARLTIKNEDSLLDAYPSSIGRRLPDGVNRAIRNAGGPHMSAGRYPLLKRSKIRRALTYCFVPQWAWLEQADVFWDEIRSIESAGARETYDLQMSSASENFIANGIVSHNSSMVEWAAIAEGALLRSGYVVYISSKQSQAEEHVVAIRNRIESEHVADVYPWLGKPKMGAHGNKFGWGREFLMTGGGWAVRPVGLDVAIRGGKTLNMRPTLLVIDDIDELGDSPYVVENKERTLTRSILPMGTEGTRVLVGQNPIHENSLVNRMLTGVNLALAIREVFGPVPAMNNFAYEIRQTDEGPHAVITQGTTTWPEVTREMWQKALNRVGPQAFLAEYQHDMTVAQEERVLPEYDDRILRLHVITWSQFEAKFGMRRIPSDWPCDCGLDIGYTGSHKSAWTFISKVPKAYELSGSIFRYRGRTFTGMGIDEQTVIIRSEMWPKERLEREFMSHEKLGERLVLAQKHGWHFLPCDSAKTAGIAQWRHFLSTDRSQPHPFHRDEKDDMGRWKLGRPSWFDVVDDRQFVAPVDDKGLKRHRDGAFNWRQVPVRLTDKGFSVEQPAKMDDDENDSTRMLTVGFGPLEQGLTPEQKLSAIIPSGYHKQELMERTDLTPESRHLTAEMAEYLAKRTMKLNRPPAVDEFGQRIER